MRLVKPANDGKISTHGMQKSTATTRGYEQRSIDECREHCLQEQGGFEQHGQPKQARGRGEGEERLLTLGRVESDFETSQETARKELREKRTRLTLKLTTLFQLSPKFQFFNFSS